MKALNSSLVDLYPFSDNKQCLMSLPCRSPSSNSAPRAARSAIRHQRSQAGRPRIADRRWRLPGVQTSWKAQWEKGNYHRRRLWHWPRHCHPIRHGGSRQYHRISSRRTVRCGGHEEDCRGEGREASSLPYRSYEERELSKVGRRGCIEDGHHQHSSEQCRLSEDDERHSRTFRVWPLLSIHLHTLSRSTDPLYSENNG